MEKGDVQRVGRVGEEKEERNHPKLKGLLLSDPFRLVVACGYSYGGTEEGNFLHSLVQGEGYNPQGSFLNILQRNISNPAWLGNFSGCCWVTNKDPAITNHPFYMEEEHRSRCDMDLTRCECGEPQDY